MRLQTSCGILTGLLAALTLGCQSNSGVTRVPAPQTGVVGTGGGAYYSNQNSSNAIYTPAGTTRSTQRDSWSPRARGPIENIASNPDGRQITYEEPVGQNEPEVIRIPVRTQEQNRVNDTYRESGLQPLKNPIELETPPPSTGGAVLKEEGGDNWVSRQ